MAYRLSLTPGERQYFDWIGYRYECGKIPNVLTDCMSEDDEWSSDDPIMFTIPEHKAWEIRDLAESDTHMLTNCGSSLRAKLLGFFDSIV